MINLLDVDVQALEEDVDHLAYLLEVELDYTMARYRALLTKLHEARAALLS
jgi:hypothetical protein